MTMTDTPDIIYTKVDEAPELASASLLPMIQSFAAAAGVGRHQGHFAGRAHHRGLPRDPDRGAAHSRRPRALGELVKTPEANVIKLPNISASVPQLVAAVKELQAQGYAIPDYPETPRPTPRRRRARASTPSRARP
jgi:isocitrate dehydrogenase